MKTIRIGTFEIIVNYKTQTPFEIFASTFWQQKQIVIKCKQDFNTKGKTLQFITVHNTNVDVDGIR